MLPPFNIADEVCAHCWDESVMVVPRPQAAVHKEECAYCCRTCQHEKGTLVCMSCHTGLCAEHVQKHTSIFNTHVMYVWIRELPSKEEDADKVKDVNKLGVVAPKEYESALCCAACAKSFVSPPELAVDCYQRILHATSMGAQVAIEADGGNFVRPQCPHLVCLEQLPNPFQAAPASSDKCVFDGCDCQLNNWMCMTCGAIGCPREQAGGSGHAVQHYMHTMHPAVVKLGTVTPSGADFYCYLCDDEVSDVHFVDHMKHFGIDVQTAKKTAKTLGEMQYDYSSQFDFNRITEEGDSLVPVFGPGRTGMHNFGNSCYMASVLQCIFSLKPFREAFYHNRETWHQNACRESPYNCHCCQTERVASGLLSGEFSVEGQERTNGITVREFKRVFAQRHPEFSTAGQQDAQEYFLYLVEQMRRYVRPSYSAGVNILHPVDIFRMTMEHRVQCSLCRKVRYTHEFDCCLSLPIPLERSVSKPNGNRNLTDEEIETSRPHLTLEACLESLMQTIDIECRCSACGVPVTYSKTTRLGTFPDVIPIFLRRAQFDMETMTVKKLDVFVEAPLELNLEFLRGAGLQADEVAMPEMEEDLPHKRTSVPIKAMDEEALAMLLSMGIDEGVARYALLQTGMNAERAVDYVFSHENIAEQAGSAAVSATVSESCPASIGDGPAQYRLHAMISHMGASAKTGHYVCHLCDAETGKWLLFNDEKVVESRNPPFSMAFLYFYKRVDKA
ncbi:putative cysteine peptidase, Clan CA, family C19 [Trypanosoma rangeli]|uniref:Ubiquitin carboxyl-terminal hydrolase n=1 Tax=Trypanosoma rangeli TaxID=5698 RepID=A0A422NEJ9_TRYRA|nr:putative cysteine peptidase, Clan CA, family C19 [Trypanosoma rangeli]RNF03884.1 putative cysteine peptidase, Clan CA, family C19 [Trypanosoma rangeli]|eukprot:RNF03884.1 putative cysteine peptidase, Clan CA, family C19 [Trypanosoma rangeli]